MLKIATDSINDSGPEENFNHLQINSELFMGRQLWRRVKYQSVFFIRIMKSSAWSFPLDPKTPGVSWPYSATLVKSAAIKKKI